MTSKKSSPVIEPVFQTNEPTTNADSVSHTRFPNEKIILRSGSHMDVDDDYSDKINFKGSDYFYGTFNAKYLYL